MNRRKGRIWVVTSLLGVATLIVPISQSPAQTAKLDAGVAATVNGEPIPMAELDAVLQAVPPTPTPPSPAELRQLRSDALDLLVEDVLIRQFLNQNAPKVEPTEYEKELAGLVAGLKAKNMTLAEYLRDTKQTDAQLKLEIIKKLQWERYTKQHVTDLVLRRHYDENRDFYDRVTVQASHIVFRVSPAAKDVERAPLKARLLELREKIVSGKLDFAEAAKKYSQCQSAARGGDIGFFPRKWAVDERVAQTAFALPVGAVSDVVQTEYGVHLVKVTARKPGKSSTFEGVKDEVRKNYTMELWQELVSKQRKSARIENKLS